MPTPTPDPHAEAKRYIDRVVALNRQHGATNEVPSDDYLDAVERAADLFDPERRHDMQAECYPEDE